MLQQKIGRSNSVVMDGRDISYKVLPWAQLKIYLDASACERAKRRLGELEEKGIKADFEEVRKEIEERDLRDSTREDSPLMKSPDAIIIDTSSMSLAQVKERVMELAKSAGAFYK
jgi:cytidylate kinase